MSRKTKRNLNHAPDPERKDRKSEAHSSRVTRAKNAKADERDPVPFTNRKTERAYSENHRGGENV